MSRLRSWYLIRAMNKSKYLITLGTAAAAGAAAGILSNRKKPGLGGLFGAVAGITAAAIAAAAYERMKEQDDDGVDYYTETSPLYQDFDDIEVE